MKVTVMGLRVGEGTVTECAEFTAKTMFIINEMAKRMEQSEIQKEIQTIWNSISKGGDKQK